MITYMNYRHECPIHGRLSGSRFFSLFESVYHVMQVSDCHDKQRANSSTCPRHAYFLISCAMHSVDKRMHASHVHERTEPTGATCACFARNRLQRSETTDDVHSFVCMGMRKLQGLCCVVVCGKSPHSASDSIIHLHQPRSRLPKARGRTRLHRQAAGSMGLH